MMREEFEQLTGFYPTADHYRAIEAAYTDYDGDKQAFCKAYKANKGGIAEKIQRTVNTAAWKTNREQSAEITRRDIEIDRLKKELEREQEWKPYESKNNVSQADYESLAASVKGGAARYMTDEEALDWVVQETGFSRRLITIIHEVATEEISRHNYIRKSGKVDRRPIYCATDYHYIRFNVRANVTNYYELWNDRLQPFWD